MLYQELSWKRFIVELVLKNAFEQVKWDKWWMKNKFAYYTTNSFSKLLQDWYQTFLPKNIHSTKYIKVWECYLQYPSKQIASTFR